MEDYKKKSIELEFDNGNIRSYAKQLEESNRELIDAVEDLMRPNNSSFFMSLQIANSAVKKAKSISKI